VITYDGMDAIGLRVTQWQVRVCRPWFPVLQAVV
jgi:hypothetical protein